MRVISQPTELNAGERLVCAAAGVFDGVHLGHQAVIRQALDDARQAGGVAVAITFDCHPQSVVAPPRAPLLIQPLARRLAGLEALGVQVALVYHFDLAFSRQTAETFIRHLVQGFGRLHGLSVSRKFRFGYQRQGNVTLLKQYGKQFGFAVREAKVVIFAGEPISSTRIRAAIQAGRLQEASLMLGWPYAIAARIVPGDKLGQQLGFPTANLDIRGLILPPNGVYAARVRLAGAEHLAVLNIGCRPTVAKATDEKRLEVHLLDWSGNLYGTELEVAFAAKLREEMAFASLAELQQQIARDVAQAKTVLQHRA